jgi:hypothetical protein
LNSLGCNACETSRGRFFPICHSPFRLTYLLFISAERERERGRWPRTHAEKVHPSVRRNDATHLDPRAQGFPRIVGCFTASRRIILIAHPISTNAYTRPLALARDPSRRQIIYTPARPLGCLREICLQWIRILRKTLTIMSLRHFGTE